MSDTPARKETALIPTGSAALTTRSSALVKRGLDTLALHRGRIVRFPPDRSMGDLKLYDPIKNVSQDLGEARGDVAVPPGMKLDLSVSDDAVFDLSPLASLRPDDLRDLDFIVKEILDNDLIHVKQLGLLEGLALGICTRLTDAGLAHVGALTALKRLHCSFLNITDPRLLYLTTLTELKSLELIQCSSIGNAGMVQIAALKKLEYLFVDGARINGIGLSYLRQLPLLSSLHIINSGIEDNDIAEHIQGLTNLTSLGLEGTCITDIGLNYLRGLTRLRELNLERCEITDSGLVNLQNVWTLEWVNLSDTNVGEQAINSFQAALPNCRIIKSGGKD